MTHSCICIFFCKDLFWKNYAEIKSNQIKLYIARKIKCKLRKGRPKKGVTGGMKTGEGISD